MGQRKPGEAEVNLAMFNHVQSLLVNSTNQHPPALTYFSNDFVLRALEGNQVRFLRLDKNVKVQTLKRFARCADRNMYIVRSFPLRVLLSLILLCLLCIMLCLYATVCSLKVIKYVKCMTDKQYEWTPFCCILISGNESANCGVQQHGQKRFALAL